MTFATTGLTAWPQIASPAAAAAPVSVGTGFTGEMLATLAQGASASDMAAPVASANDSMPAAPATLPLSAFIPVHPGAAAFAQPLLAQPVQAPHLPTAATAPTPLTAPKASIEAPAAGAAQPDPIAADVRPSAGSAMLPNILAAQVVPTADRSGAPAGASLEILGRPASDAPPEAAGVAKSGPAPRDALFAQHDSALPTHVAPPTWAVPPDPALDMPLSPAAIPTPTQAAMQTPAQPVVQTPAQTVIRTPAQTAIPEPAPAAIQTPAQAAIPTPAQGPARRLPAEGTERTARTRARAPDGEEPQPAKTPSGAAEMASPTPAILLSAAVSDSTKTRDPQTDVTADRGDAPKANAGGVAVARSPATRDLTANDVGRSTAAADATPFVPASPASDVASDARPMAPAFTLADPVQSVTRPVPTAAPIAPPPVPVIPAQPGRIGHDLGVEIARRVSVGGDELVVRLDPAELGRIEVRMSFDDRGGLKTVIAADSPVALDMLRRDSADLGRSLSDAGFQGAGQGLRFDSGSGDRSQGQPRSPWHSANQKPGHADDFGAAPDFDQTAYRSLRTSGRYDLIA